MGYLSKGLPKDLHGLVQDVFISYSHGAFPGESHTALKRWSERLKVDLEEELRLDLQGDVSIFLDDSERRDESLDRSEDLSSQVKSAVQASALLATLVSPQYLRSHWCRDEREWWQDANTPDDLAVGSRLFPCHVLPTAEDQMPEALAGPTGYYFFDRDRLAKTGSARPFTYRQATSDRDDYLDVLYALSGDLAHRLKTLRRLFEEHARHLKQQQKLAQLGGQVLYLYGRPESQSLWDAACGKLLDQDFVVNPEAPAPIPADGGLDGESRVQLVNSDAMLILGTQDGPALDSDMTVVGRNFRQLAVAGGRPFLPCAVFDAVGADARSERRRRNAANMGISWIDGTRNDWADDLRLWLREAG